MKEEIQTWVYIVIGAGGLVFLIIVGIIIYLCCRKRKGDQSMQRTQITPLAQNTQLTDMQYFDKFKKQEQSHLPNVHIHTEDDEPSAIGMNIDNAINSLNLVKEPYDDVVMASEDILGDTLHKGRRKLKANGVIAERSRQDDLTANVSPNMDTNSSLPHLSSKKLQANNLQAFIDQYSKSK